MTFAGEELGLLGSNYFVNHPTIPLQNVVSRHVEREADWIALQTTRDPRAAQAAFAELGQASLTQPRPPTWAYLLFDDHPTIMQRIEMTKAWQ